MEKITADAGTLNVNSGTIGLTAAQAKPRMHLLQAVEVDKRSGNGVYRILGPIQFKQGETFYYDGQLNKAGVLSDPAAEREAKHAAAANAVATARAQLEPELRARIQDEVRTEFGPKLRDEIDATVRAELEPKLREEIDAALRLELKPQLDKLAAYEKAEADAKAKK